MNIPSFNPLEESQVKAELDHILAQDFDQLSRAEALRIVLSCIDLTTLEGSDNAHKIEEVCRTARQFKNNGADIPNVAAVCFYPPFAAQAKSLLKGSGIQVACVAGAFPSGQAPLELRVEEVKYTVAQGADEIDMVISRGKYLEGDFTFVHQEVAAHKKACGSAHLKVILETGELLTLAMVRHASEIAINAGADFIKTSTGKIPQAATLEAFYVMLYWPSRIIISAPDKWWA
jgi:deoxyribose-phosphate aldolase